MNPVEWWNKSSVKRNTKLLRKRSLHRAGLLLKYCLNRREKRPFFVLSTRRSGSNLLLDYLNSVPGISFAPEILNWEMFYGVRARFISKKAVLRHIAHSLNACHGTVCGAKLLRVHLRAHGITARDLKERFPAAKFIVLYRESLIDQYLSLKIAEKTGAWTWGPGFRLPQAITIDPLSFRNYCAKIADFYRNILDDPELDGKTTALSYEELEKNPQGVFESKLFPFLAVPPCEIRSEMVKQNTKRPHELILNYKEIRALEERDETCRLSA